MEEISKTESYLNQQKSELTAFVFFYHSHSVAVSHMMKLVRIISIREIVFPLSCILKWLKKLQQCLKIANKKTVILSY